MRRMLMAGVIAAFAAASAQADEIVIQNRPNGGKGEVRVQVNMSFFVAGPVNGSEASLKSQEEARRVLYESAGRECAVLRATIATDCRIESVGVNINRSNYGQAQNEGFSAVGNFAFRVTPK
jgi:hypothetical protein